MIDFLGLECIFFLDSPEGIHEFFYFSFAVELFVVFAPEQFDAFS